MESALQMTNSIVRCSVPQEAGTKKKPEKLINETRSFTPVEKIAIIVRAHAILSALAHSTRGRS